MHADASGPWSDPGKYQWNEMTLAYSLDHSAPLGGPGMTGGVLGTRELPRSGEHHRHFASRAQLKRVPSAANPAAKPMAT